jgi:hypothetical protein
MRVQRTRSSASPLRSPLTRYPLGGSQPKGLLLGAVLIAGFARASLGEGSVAVRIVDQGGYRLPNDAFVRVGEVVSYPNADGVARVLDLPAGVYAVEVFAEGFKPCFPMSVRIVDDQDLSIVYWVQLENWLGPLIACLIPPMRMSSVEITDPASLTRVAVGQAVRIAWHIVNGPVDPKGWEVRILISGCAEAMGSWPIAAFPLEGSPSSVLWRPTQDIVEWMEHCNSPEEECRFPVNVCLYNAAARGQQVGLISHDDDLIWLGENCHAAGGNGAYVDGSTADGDGRLWARASEPK